MKLEYFSNVKDGKLQKNVSLLIAKEIKHFEGKRIHLKIEKLKSKRSTQQNRLYWLYITIIAKELGYDKEELHSIVGFKFLKREKVIESTGELMPYIESTTKLGKGEFADFICDLQQWASEMFNIILPNPGDNFEIFND